jgi:sec-independent protein translocase protein TatC
MSEPAPEFASVEDDSGAKKSFWEHLKDLRGALVKSAIALGAALVLCLLLDQQLVGILEYPLHRMNIFQKAKPTVTLELGAAKLGPYAVTREDFPALPPGDAPNAVYKIGITQVGRDQVLTLKLDPTASAATPEEVRLHNLSPGEAFFVAFHVALYGAIAVSSPFWIYFLGGFILPALNFKERRVIFSWLGWGLFLFLAGVLSTYFLMLPVALKASVKYSNLLGFSAADWQANEYISFVCKFILGMGVGFQFPLVVLFLVKLGLVTYKQLAHYRRHVVVLSLILGAVLTTPEPVTQIAMAVPLYLLYEICIWIAWYWDRKKRKLEQQVG